MVRTARLAAQCTQAEAARLVYLSTAGRWSEYENGHKRMERSRFELFLLLTQQHPDYTLAPRGATKPTRRPSLRRPSPQPFRG